MDSSQSKDIPCLVNSHFSSYASDLYYLSLTYFPGLRPVFSAAVARGEPGTMDVDTMHREVRHTLTHSF